LFHDKINAAVVGMIVWKDCGKAIIKREIFFLTLLNAELNPICRLLALLGAHLILHVSRIRITGEKN
jgi:hypothetical protein